jgi:hypothetical protein
MGAEHAPGLRPWIERAARDRPLRVGEIGSDLLLLNRSDYGPFRNRRVPYLFFSTGESPCYHRPDDLPRTIDYPKLAAISGMILDVARQAADADAVPRWSDAPTHTLAEAVTLRDMIRKLLESGEAVKLGSAQKFVMNRTLGNLEEVIARGVMSPAERAGLIQAARLVLLMVR